MAPAPHTRITRSAKANTLTDLGKSPPKITKKNKKPDAASRPYRHNINTQNGSDSSDVEEGKSTQKATTNPARKSQASRPKFGTTKTYLGAKTQTQPLKSSILGKVRGKSNLPGPHIVTDTKTGETLYLSASSDSSTTLFKGLHENEPVDFFAGETPPPRLYEPKSVEVLHRLLTSFPRLRYDYQALEDVLANAQPQTPEQISKCYQDLRSAAWEWAKGTFDHGSLDRLDLMQLAETNPQLMEYINSTTASPQLTDWETWIGKRKAAIVYAILGKVIEVHVFGEEFFGASDSQKAHLRKWDREKMDWDGFKRQKLRAAAITVFLDQHIFPHSFFPALQNLQGQIISLLNPLLPSFYDDDPIFSTTHPLNLPLQALLLSAASLAIAIRRTPDHIYYFTAAPSPGAKYDRYEVDMLNPAEMEIAMDVKGVKEMMRKGGIKCVVGVSGWPGLVGYTPVYGNGDNAEGKGKQKEEINNARREPGILTLHLSNPSIYTILSAAPPFSTFSKPPPRNTLRSDLYTRSLCHPIERKVAKAKRNRRIALAAVVLALAGYYGNWEWVRRAVGRESWDEIVIRKRGEWLGELRRGGERWVRS